MSVSTNSSDKPRIPLEVEGIQINFCKNPCCGNFGVPASPEKQPRGRGAAERGRDSYKVESGTYGSGRPGTPVITCLKCNERPPIKSNYGIIEERTRMTAYLVMDDPSCPNVACDNHGAGISQASGLYYQFGKTAAGSPRYRCRACGKTFSINLGKPAKNHILPHKNSEVFNMLVNTVPMRRICKIAGISQKTFYDKIRFLHQQTQAFVARRERRLLNGELKLDKLYLSVDRQDHMVNWTNRKDKRQTQFHAVGTADNDSSYVFAIHLNYDPDLHPQAVEIAAQENGDYDLKAPFRRYARLWLQGDYAPAAAERAKTARIKQVGLGLQALINQTYAEVSARTDVESFDLPAEYTQFPVKGMQVHAEYTLYGHFFFLRDLLRHVGKLRFFLDQESGIRAACLAAFQDRILARECDAFYVSINKLMTNDQKEKAMREVYRKIVEMRERYPYDLTDTTLRRMLIEEALHDKSPVGPWRDMWVDVPSRIKSEPERKVCHLTEFNDYDNCHLAALLDKASLHGVDRFFAQVRNSLSLLARAPSSASNAGRTWFQRNAYNPEIVSMLLDIYRVNYNYLEVGDDKMTPAMRIGLAKSKVRLTDILTFEDRCGK